MTLQEFYDQLAKHDWYHVMSDDISVDRRGAADWHRLIAIAQQSEAHAMLMEAWRNYMWTGEPWKTVRAPKPQRPTA